MRKIILFIFIPFFVNSLELNLLCTNNAKENQNVDVKDLFVNIDAISKSIELGGLSFSAKTINISQTNISWSADEIPLYVDSAGSVNGIIGRFSGNLELDFVNYSNGHKSSLSFNCKKFKFKDRRF
tara:strand:+ start:260 stop:637 length:378 start_codon:yes stop_codon:yes gene_type:complete